MYSRARVARHPLHPMFVPFPIGLWTLGFSFDLVFVATSAPFWHTAAQWTILGGVTGAALAALPGFIDYLTIPGRNRAKTDATLHMLLNVAILGLFTASLVLHFLTGTPTRVNAIPEVILGGIGVFLLTFSGWLGGELVYRHGISIEPQAPIQPIAREEPGEEPGARRPAA